MERVEGFFCPNCGGDIVVEREDCDSFTCEFCDYEKEYLSLPNAERESLL